MMPKKARLDLLSNLHDDLLAHVFSFLPTKDVFRTSVLSTNWRYRWRCSYIMEVDDENNQLLFVRLMLWLLILSHSQQRLKSFSLTLWHRYDPPLLHAWISALLKHGAQTLELNCYNKRPTEVVFPTNLLNSTSLRKLDLCWKRFTNYSNAATMNVHLNNYAPNLTTLSLFGVNIINMDSTTTVKFSFPVLETLMIRCCRWLDVKLVEIDAPSLTSFVSDPDGAPESNLEPGPGDHSIHIYAPRLATLTCPLGFPQNFIFCKGTGRTSLVSAVFNSYLDMYYLEGIDPKMKELFPATGLRIGNYINSFLNLEELGLSDFIAKILPPTRLSLHGKLRRLRLVHSTDTKTLLRILHMAPSIKFFSMEWDSWGDDIEDLRDSSSLPTCISHLEEVELIIFSPSEDDKCRVAEFFMKNGTQLNKLRLVIDDRDVDRCMTETKEILSSYDKSSANLTIEFAAYPNQNSD